MRKEDLVTLVEGILTDHGVPRRIKDELEQSLQSQAEDKLSQIISILDDASSNPNLSMGARTHIWSIVSTLEGEISKK